MAAVGSQGTIGKAEGERYPDAQTEASVILAREADKEKDAEARRRAEAKRLNLVARAEFVRAIALVVVVVAIVATPIYAMAAKVVPEDFSTYIAPVTGIAGAVIGYWFGASGRTSQKGSSHRGGHRPAPM
jgi:hypothetical protein